jgi:predicted  nucleic acid-binding Zn-ribbon protein
MEIIILNIIKVNRIKEELEGKKEQIVKLEQSLAQAENARKVAEQKLEEQVSPLGKKCLVI